MAIWIKIVTNTVPVRRKLVKAPTSQKIRVGERAENERVSSVNTSVEKAMLRAVSNVMMSSKMDLSSDSIRILPSVTLNDVSLM
jgi:hypothetical protein